MGINRLRGFGGQRWAAHVGSVAFVWDAVGGADSYILQVGTATGQSDTFDTDVGNVLSHSLNLATGTYYARVIAVTDDVEGDPSDEQVVTV